MLSHTMDHPTLFIRKNPNFTFTPTFLKKLGIEVQQNSPFFQLIENICAFMNQYFDNAFLLENPEDYDDEQWVENINNAIQNNFEIYDIILSIEEDSRLVERIVFDQIIDYEDNDIKIVTTKY